MTDLQIKEVIEVITDLVRERDVVTARTDIAVVLISKGMHHDEAVDKAKALVHTLFQRPL